MNRRTLIIVASVLGVGILALAILGFLRANQQAGSDTAYTDPGSGEVIRNDKSQQGSDLSVEKTIVWLGFSTLLQRGLTADQITSTQDVITKYSNTQPERFKEVSITTDSYRHLLPNESPDHAHKITFDMTANRTNKYYVEIIIDDDTSTTHTKLFKDDKTTLLIEG